MMPASSATQLGDQLAQAGVAQELDYGQGPTILRILEDNPGRFTGPGTNTFLIGDEALWIIDPGEDRNDGHKEAIHAAVADREVQGILITHAHADHWPLGARLADELGTPMIAYADRSAELPTEHGVFAPHRLLSDGESLCGTDFRLTCLPTPGHCADHIAFVLHGDLKGDTRSPVVFSGDHVMSWSTTILAPPDGCLNGYLASLECLLKLDPVVLLPAHGPAISDPAARMRELRDHRHARTHQLLEALRRAPATLEALVPVIYKDTDPALHPAAAASLNAHIEALLEDGRIARQGEGFRIVPTISDR